MYEYAFLFDFYMSPSVWEDEAYVMQTIKKKHPERIDKRSFDEITEKIRSMGKKERASYCIAWTEEIRRVITQKLLQLVRRTYISDEKDSCYYVNCQSLLRR